MIKLILSGLGYCIAVLILLFLGLLVHFNLNHWRAQKAQRNYQKTLSAHNSYKQYGSAPGKLMIRLVQNKHEAMFTGKPGTYTLTRKQEQKQ